MATDFTHNVPLPVATKFAGEVLKISGYQFPPSWVQQ